jgi:hypothetical protein
MNWKFTRSKAIVAGLAVRLKDPLLGSTPHAEWSKEAQLSIVAIKGQL